MKILNLNSSIVVGNKIASANISDLELEIDVLNAGFWQSKANQSPLILVDENTMDIIYEPRKRYCLRKPKFDNFLPENRFSTEPDEPSSLFIAIGVHIGVFNVDNYNFDEVKKNNLRRIIGSNNIEAIFICPERVKKISDGNFYNKNKNSFNILFKVISLHEIAHAYMYQKSSSDKVSRKWYSKYWGKIIEESFANIVAWNLLPDDEKDIAEFFMNSQPFEYNAFQFWKQNGSIYNGLPMLISSWLNGERCFNDFHFYDFNDLFKSLPYNLIDYNNFKKDVFTLSFEEDRIANEFVNIFNGGKDESWEKLAGKIIEYMQMWDAYNKQILIYEIEGDDALNNYNVLFDKSNDNFYWDDKYFKKLTIGDYVFVVNYKNTEVLFCKLEKLNIAATLINGKWEFTDTDNNTIHSVSGKRNYESFIRLKVIDIKANYSNLNWKSLRNGESTFINGTNINLNTKENRLLNIEYLLTVFPEPYFNILLNKCKNNFLI
jgi:hypothetical protein